LINAAALYSAQSARWAKTSVQSALYPGNTHKKQRLQHLNLSGQSELS